MKANHATSDEYHAMNEAEHLGPPSPPPSALEGIEEPELVQAKLVEALHALQRLRPSQIKNHARAERAFQEALTIV